MSEKKSLNTKNLEENALDDAELDKVAGGLVNVVATPLMNDIATPLMNDIATPSLLNDRGDDKPEVKSNSVNFLQ